MATRKSVRSIVVLRLGNPWLVGKNVNRVVPVYALQNVLAPSFVKDPNFQGVKDLTQSAKYAAERSLLGRIKVPESAYADLEQTAHGIVSPERRVFGQEVEIDGVIERCANPEGAPFPLVGGMATSTGSDDGLGKRVRELLEKNDSDWRDRLDRLFLPPQPTDPVTAFAFALLKQPPGLPQSRVTSEPLFVSREITGHEVHDEVNFKPRTKLTGFDRSIVDFIDALIVGTPGGNRISTIRNLAYGIYLASVVRMVSGPIIYSKRKHHFVLAYAGLPPGAQNDPLVRMAIRSYQDWISQSWHCTCDLISAAIDKVKIKATKDPVDNLSTKVRTVLADQMKPLELDTLMSLLEKSLRDHAKKGASQWLEETISETPLEFPQHELARRVRGLGTSIGFAGPDRGYGSARLLFDTPLLGVLVRGLVPTGRLPLDKFVSLVAERLGIVLGPGVDDELVDKLPTPANSGLDKFEILKSNQDLLRERLLRVGLARVYSDSHTEVFGDA